MHSWGGKRAKKILVFLSVCYLYHLWSWWTCWNITQKTSRRFHYLTQICKTDQIRNEHPKSKTRKATDYYADFHILCHFRTYSEVLWSATRRTNLGKLHIFFVLFLSVSLCSSLSTLNVTQSAVNYLFECRA